MTDGYFSRVMARVRSSGRSVGGVPAMGEEAFPLPVEAAVVDAAVDSLRSTDLIRA